MEKNIRRLVLLFSLVLVAIPMVVFPNRLGLGLGGGSAVNLLYEMVFYGVVLFLFRRNTTLVALTVGVALTLVYRLALGAAFGLALVVMYDLGLSVAFSLGMAKYVPAILLQVACAPFVLRPVYLGLVARLAPGRRERAFRQMPRSIIREDVEMNAPSVSLREAVSAATTRSESVSPTAMGEGSLFDRAVGYLGESAAVRMAVLVDQEGLPLAKFVRGREDVDAWAPLAVMVLGSNRTLVARVGGQDNPDRVDIGTRGLRLLVRRIDRVILMVAAEPTIDETIHIRIAQAADMIRKYMSERYSPAVFARVEGRYVSNS
jgi:predicted regulator of Ras-like GTPase activity (Roadblock/LC7/MglB family)